jgi:hypothetical protein
MWNFQAKYVYIDITARLLKHAVKIPNGLSAENAAPSGRWH